MNELDITISDLNDISEILDNNGYGGWCKTLDKAVELLKEQKEIIDNYHKADTFLAVHGWQWKETTTESSTNPKDGEQE